MRAVLISAYVVLLVAIASEGPAHAQENSAQLTAVKMAVRQNTERLSSLMETAEETHGLLQTVAQSLTSMNAMLNLVSHPYMKDSCMFNDLPYPSGSTVEAICSNQTCNKGEWISDYSYFNPLCCKARGIYLPDGTTLEHLVSCKPTCTSGKWINDQQSSMCCDYKDDYYNDGTNINEEGVNRTCVDGTWNIIINNPVLEFGLLPGKENVESILIRYNPSIYDGSGRNWYGSTYWVDILNEMIKPYEGRGDHEYGIDIKDCSEENTAQWGQVCKFDSQMLGDYCNKAEDWGYARHSPCVILKMSRMTGWTPDVYRGFDELPRDMPEDLKEYIQQATEYHYGNMPQMVWVHCKCQNPAHEQYIRQIELTPWKGFPAYYFPYRNTPGYLDPIVAVRFDTSPHNVPINIECKAYAKNIVHNSKERIGVIQFELQKIE